MGIVSSLTHMDTEGPPHKHTITLNIAFDAGGGSGTTNVNATILWNPAQLQLIAGSSSPGGGVHSPATGLMIWNNVNVDENGTDFVVELECLGGAALRTSQVQGIAEEVPAGQRPTRYTVTTTC